MRHLIIIIIMDSLKQKGLQNCRRILEQQKIPYFIIGHSLTAAEQHIDQYLNSYARKDNALTQSQLQAMTQSINGRLSEIAHSSVRIYRGIEQGIKSRKNMIRDINGLYISQQVAIPQEKFVELIQISRKLIRDFNCLMKVPKGSQSDRYLSDMLHRSPDDQEKQSAQQKDTAIDYLRQLLTDNASLICYFNKNSLPLYAQQGNPLFLKQNQQLTSQSQLVELKDMCDRLLQMTGQMPLQSNHAQSHEEKREETLPADLEQQAQKLQEIKKQANAKEYQAEQSPDNQHKTPKAREQKWQNEGQISQGKSQPTITVTNVQENSDNKQKPQFAAINEQNQQVIRKFRALAGSPKKNYVQKSNKPTFRSINSSEHPAQQAILFMDRSKLAVQRKYSVTPQNTNYSRSTQLGNAGMQIRFLCEKNHYKEQQRNKTQEELIMEVSSRKSLKSLLSDAHRSVGLSDKRSKKLGGKSMKRLSESLQPLKQTKFDYQQADIARRRQLQQIAKSLKVVKDKAIKNHEIAAISKLSKISANKSDNQPQVDKKVHAQQIHNHFQKHLLHENTTVKLAKIQKTVSEQQLVSLKLTQSQNENINPVLCNSDIVPSHHDACNSELQQKHRQLYEIMEDIENQNVEKEREIKQEKVKQKGIQFTLLERKHRIEQLQGRVLEYQEDSLTEQDGAEAEVSRLREQKKRQSIDFRQQQDLMLSEIKQVQKQITQEEKKLSQYQQKQHQQAEQELQSVTRQKKQKQIHAMKGLQEKTKELEKAVHRQTKKKQENEKLLEEQRKHNEDIAKQLERQQQLENSLLKQLEEISQAKKKKRELKEQQRKKEIEVLQREIEELKTVEQQTLLEYQRDSQAINSIFNSLRLKNQQLGANLRKRAIKVNEVTASEHLQ